MFIDTHCHLTDEFFTENGLDSFIRNAKDNNVGALICASAEYCDIKKVINIANEHNNVFCTIGIHPEYADSFTNEQLSDLQNSLNNKKVIGVGEIGLDYHYGIEHKNKQIELFERQLDIARQSNLPVAIHTREAEDDTAKILDGSVSGVMHCYTSSWDLAKKMLDRGFYFSASGIITFKNSDDLRETFRKIPTDRIVIETDSPWCAPVPYRGKKCEPAFVIETAKIISQIKNLQFDELETILTENTKRLYPKCQELL